MTMRVVDSPPHAWCVCPATRTARQVVSLLCGADLGEEAVDVAAQGLRLLAELLGRGEDLVGGAAGLGGRLVDADDVARHLAGALRRFLHIAGDLPRRRALLLDR